MLVVINPIDNAPFLKGAKKFIGDPEDGSGDPDDPSGREIEEEYKDGYIPGTTQVLNPFFNENLGKYEFDENYLPEDKFKELVPECNIFDELGNHITKVNLNFDGDKFINHADMALVLDKGRAVFDDDLPKNKIKAAFFMKHVWFKLIGEDSDSLHSAFQKYEIGLQEHVHALQTKALQEEFNAHGALLKMSRTKMLFLCRLWDYTPNDDIGDNSLQLFIYQKLKETGNYFIGSETRSEFFPRFVKMPEDEMEYWVSFYDANKNRGITRNAEGSFVFRGTILGRTMQESVEFLSRVANERVYSEIKGFLSQNIKMPKVLKKATPDQIVEEELKTEVGEAVVELESVKKEIEEQKAKIAEYKAQLEAEKAEMDALRASRASVEGEAKKDILVESFDEQKEEIKSRRGRPKREE